MTELTAYYKGSVGFLALEAILISLQMKAVVVRAQGLKNTCQCPRCRLYHAKQVSELQVEIADFVKWCKEAKGVEKRRLAERKEVK